MSGKIDYQRLLNPAQLKAVMSVDGPLLVIAGAGSGKTRTLVYRVAYLVETDVPPENILLLTFTRKAATEMLERASGLTNEKCRHVTGGTFHSLAYRVLRSHADLVGFHHAFTILDRSDMEEVIQSLVREMKIDKGAIRFPKRSTLATILSKSSNLQWSIEDLLKEEYAQFMEYIPEMKGLARQYQEHKRENQLMDYDDLILFFRKLLVENEDIRDELSDQYRYIMVDEYQDTNAIQADIVKWLADKHHNIMVVGDDSQAIYSFRGADYRNMFDFPELFHEVTTIKLEENYRSTQPILTFTNALMGQAVEKYTKCLFTNRTDGELPRVIDTRTEPEQAMFICRSINDLLLQGRSIRDIAVLFRAAYQSFELELELNRQGIPYVKYGGFKFMESAHIKDLLSHFRVVLNRDDTIGWVRILRLIKNIGHGKSRSIIDWMRETQCQAWQIGEWPGSRKKDGGLERLAQLLKALSAPDVSPDRAVKLAVEYYEPILKEKYDDFPRRLKDLEQLIPMAGRYRRLRAFMDDLIMEPPTSSLDMDRQTRPESLTLSTVHSAKGLEWSSVFILWVMDGYFPPSKAMGNMDAVEEERRLMYVASTRAKDQLTLCYPSQESPPFWSGRDGSGRYARGGLSSFIQALSEDVFEHQVSGLSGRRPPVRWPADQAPTLQMEEKNTSRLRPGDRVRHPAFGRGVVSKFLDKEKVEVLFRNVGRKLLHLEYTTLEKI